MKPIVSSVIRVKSPRLFLGCWLITRPAIRLVRFGEGGTLSFRRKDYRSTAQSKKGRADAGRACSYPLFGIPLPLGAGIEAVTRQRALHM